MNKLKIAASCLATAVCTIVAFTRNADAQTVDYPCGSQSAPYGGNSNPYSAYCIEAWVGPTYGIFSSSINGVGVVGEDSGNGDGVFGAAKGSGNGVNGYSQSGPGVRAYSSYADGVNATSSSGYGAAGVHGITQGNGWGVHAEVSPYGSGTAIYAENNSSTGWAGYFLGSVKITGNLSCGGS